MSNYRRKLRSSSTKSIYGGEEEQEQEDNIKKEDESIYQDQHDLLYQQVQQHDPPSPRTPPTQSIEPYFPPSPFGRKRHQPHGDR